MKHITHDYNVYTCDDPIFDDYDFSFCQLRSAYNIRKAIAKELKVPTESVTLELSQNDDLNEAPDRHGIGLNTYDIFINGKFRNTVWVEDAYIIYK